MIYKEIVKQLKDFDDLLLYNLESEIKKEFERRNILNSINYLGEQSSQAQETKKLKGGLKK